MAEIIVVSDNKIVFDLLNNYYSDMMVRLFIKDEFSCEPKINSANLIVFDDYNCFLEVEIPILLLTNSYNYIEKTGYYLVQKPFRTSYFFSIIDDLTKASKPEEFIYINNVKFSFIQKILSMPDGTDHYLTQKEAELLLFFVENKELKFTKSDLLKEVWGYSSIIDSHTLGTHIYRLRQKLGNVISTDEKGRYFLKND